MPPIISWAFQGFRDIQGRFTRATAEAKVRSKEIAKEAARLMIEELKKFAPVGTHYEISPDGKSVTELRPETLRNSITFKTFSKPTGMEVKFYAISYVTYVVNPTRPHWILPKKGTYLRFYWPNAPGPVIAMFPDKICYFRAVYHKGTRGNPFHERALLSLEPALTHTLQTAAVTVKTRLEQ